MKDIGSRVTKKNRLKKEQREINEYRLAVLSFIISMLAFIKSWF
ncbi:hypothetical protein [Lacticaseibacillus brantae]|nr:hypothetical protein [Lacticaseibacillus brantae]